MADEAGTSRDLADPSTSSHQSPRPSRGRGGKRGGGSGGNRGGEQSREMLVSKALSKLLRHQAENEGLKLDSEGYAKVEEVLKWNRLKSLKATFADIRIAVSDNSKQRFAIKLDPAVTPPPSSDSSDPAHWLIRANQGHSIAIDSAALLKPITLEANNIPEVVVHGTYYGFYDAIVSSGGLKAMGRNHIHFSTGLPEDKGGVISGMRKDAEILFYVDVRKSLEDGAAQWWISDNGVVLTEGGEAGMVSARYWKKVAGRRQEVGVLWEDGREVGELPLSFRNKKAPSGKGPRGKREGEKKGRGRGGETSKEPFASAGENNIGISTPDDK